MTKTALESQRYFKNSKNLLQQDFSSGERKKLYLKTFLLSLGLSVLIFLPFVIYDKGLFLFYGDFNVQQIPFYKLAHHAVKTGDLFWNWKTDLGVNFIGSYSFYLLGSPFFYLTLLFPNHLVPYLMAPLLCLKFATAATTGTAYMTRFTKNKTLAMLGGLLYSFSGFSIYNIFFNHFHDVVAFFPLLLIGLEDFMKKERRGLFALAVFINATISYFFFVGQVVFLIIYLLVRIYTGGFKMTVKKFISLAIESAAGFLMSLWILLPSVLAILSNPRVSSFPDGWGALLYWKEQRYPQIFTAFFFPPELPSSPNFFADAEAKWSSIGGWFPLVSMCGVIAFLKSKKKNFIKLIIIICIVFAFVPILNSAFYAFNSSYYARWFYMPILMMALATILSFEDKKVDLSFGIKVTANITVATILLLGFMPKTEDDLLTFGLYKHFERFWAWAAMAMICIVSMMILYRFFKRGRRFNKAVLIGTSVAIVMSSIMFLAFGKAGREKYDEMKEALLGWDNFELGDEETKDQFYRIDVLNGMDNQAMFYNLPTIQTFHSVVPGSIMEFYPSIGVKRDVGSRPETDHVGLRAFASVKYLFVKDEGEDTDQKMPYFHYLNTQNSYRIYENENYLPMGFTYDYYLSESQFEGLPENLRENALLGAVYLDEETAKTYGKYFKEATYSQLSGLTDEVLLDIVRVRKQETAYYFVYDNKGFTAKVNAKKDTILTFTVPFEKGWSATVDGNPAEIVKVNIGFMGVVVPKGESEIRFDFDPPGLGAGFLLMTLGIGLLGIYIIFLSKPLTDKKEEDIQLSFY